MMGMNLAALSQQDLKQLLATARARGQTALETKILEEMRERPTRPDTWRPGATASFGSETGMFGAAPPGRRIRRRRLTPLLFIPLIALVAAGATWGLSLQVEPRVEAAALATSKPVLQPVPGTAPPPSVAPTAPPKKVIDTRIRQASENPCYDEPTPADRLVCGYPAVAARDRELRSVYAQAIVAGADPRGLEAEQATWTAQRNGISEWKDLAEAYDRRIAALRSALAERPPGS